MVKNIIKDINFLSNISLDATIFDLYIVKDLLDTIKFNSYKCVGMAANMIGYLKRILVFDNNGLYEVMINPCIIMCDGPYKTMEGCLSLDGMKECIRHKKIKVEYLNEDFKKRTKTYTGLVAEIIEHEIDHFNGIII